MRLGVVDLGIHLGMGERWYGDGAASSAGGVSRVRVGDMRKIKTKKRV